jgi:IclR family acetate operon transcriptional repressor
VFPAAASTIPAMRSTPQSDADTDESSSAVKTLGRGLDVLRLFASVGPELSQTDIATASGLPLPTVYRLVRTLVAYDFLEPIPPGRQYRLGSEMLRLAGPLLGRIGSPQGIHERLRDLSLATGETTNLATLVGAEIVYLDGVTGTRFLTPQATIGLRIEAHCTALGKSLLAQLDDDEILERLGPGPYARSTEHTARDWPELKKRLDEVRAEGIAISDEEYELGLTSIAIALSRRPDRELRAINVALPLTRATPDFRQEIIERLRTAAVLLDLGDTQSA